MNIKQVLHHLNRRDTRLLPKNLTLTKLISISLIIFSAIFLTKNIIAQTTTPTSTLNNTTQQEILDKQNAFNKVSQESWLESSVYSNAMIVTKNVGGTFSSDNLSGKTAWIPQGMIGLSNNAIASLYNPPISGTKYIAESINNFIGKPVYAQGIGSEGLKGIQDLWKTMRNVSYTVISLIFIIIGIMIMLRVKISPQLVVNIQNAIPKIVSALILVTFSYAIAGLLIDLSYVLQGLVLSLFFQSKGGLTSQLFNGGINPTFAELNSLNFWGTFSLLTKATPILWLTGLAAIPSAIIGTIIGFTGIFTFGAGAVLGLVVGGISFAVIMAIVMIFILVQVIKFFFGIAKCYINLIIRIILGPLEISMGAIPGSKLNFSTWITEVIANLAVFPISVIFLVLSLMILDAVTNTGMWIPQFFIGGGVIGAVLGLTILTLFAKLPTLIPEMVFNIKPSPLGKAIGEGFGGITKSIKTGTKYGTGFGLDKVNNKYGSEDNEGDTARMGNKWWNKTITGARRLYNETNRKK